MVGKQGSLKVDVLLPYFLLSFLVFFHSFSNCFGFGPKLRRMDHFVQTSKSINSIEIVAIKLYKRET